MRAIILRGLPGSGKSTFAKQNFREATVVSADHFFQYGEVYRFDPSKLHLAHQQSLSNFRDAVDHQVETIVVDNTNTRFWEFADYVQYASDQGYSIEVIRLATDPEIAASRNIHGVSPETVEKMHCRFEDYPGERTIKQ